MSFSIKNNRLCPVASLNQDPVEPRLLGKNSFDKLEPTSVIIGDKFEVCTHPKPYNQNPIDKACVFYPIAGINTVSQQRLAMNETILNRLKTIEDCIDIEEYKTFYLRLDGEEYSVGLRQDIEYIFINPTTTWFSDEELEKIINFDINEITATKEHYTNMKEREDFKCTDTHRLTSAIVLCALGSYSNSNSDISIDDFDKLWQQRPDLGIIGSASNRYFHANPDNTESAIVSILHDFTDILNDCYHNNCGEDLKLNEKVWGTNSKELSAIYAFFTADNHLREIINIPYDNSNANLNSEKEIITGGE